MNILYLVHRVPYPLNKGERIRCFQILNYLSRRASVHLACLADEPVQEGSAAMLRRCATRLAIAPLAGPSRWLRALGSLLSGQTVTEGAFSSPALRQTLRQWASDTHFDVALISSSALVPYLRTKELRDIPAVIDLIDVDSEKWLDYARTARGAKSWVYSTEGRRLRQLERDLAGWARAVVLVSEAEVRLLRGFSVPGTIRSVSVAVDLDRFQPQPPGTEPVCLFVGGLDYFPNVDGVSWFCRDVWPAIHRCRPDATLQLVGRNPVSEVRALSEVPGVQVVGEVPDVRPFLARAAIVLVPLHIARGVQNKVLEALAMAKSVVVSPGALRGLGAQAGVHLLTASSPAEWTQTILKLFGDEVLRQQLGQAGRRFIEERHSPDHCFEPLGELLGLASPSPHADSPNSRAVFGPQRSLTSAGGDHR